MGTLIAARFRLLVALELAVSAALGFYRLGTPSLWLDEAVGWCAASGSWSYLFSRAVAGDDTGGFLFATLAHLWIPLAGSSETALRLPGVLFGLATTALTIWTARRLWSRDTALWAGAVTAIHPSLIGASRTARGYVLLVLVAAWCLHLLTRQWQQSRRTGGVAMAVVALAAPMTHVFGVFLVAGTALCSWLIASRVEPGPEGRRLTVTRSSLNQIASAARPLVPFVPALAFALLWALAMRGRIRANLAAFWTSGSLLRDHAGVVVVLLLPVVAGCVCLWWFEPRHRRRALVVGAAVLTTPVWVGPILVSLLASGGHHFVNIRYAIALLPLGTLAFGYAFSCLPMRIAVVALLLGSVAVGANLHGKNTYATATRDGSETRDAAAFLRGHMAPGAARLVYPDYERVSLDYYGVAAGGCPASRPDVGPDAPRAEPWRRGRPTWVVAFNETAATIPAGMRADIDTWRFGRLVVTRAVPRLWGE